MTFKNRLNPILEVLGELAQHINMGKMAAGLEPGMLQEMGLGGADMGHALHRISDMASWAILALAAHLALTFEPAHGVSPLFNVRMENAPRCGLKEVDGQWWLMLGGAAVGTFDTLPLALAETARRGLVVEVVEGQ